MSMCRPCAQRVLLLSRQMHTQTHSSARGYDAAVAALNGLQSNFAVVEAIKKARPGANKRAIPVMLSWLRRIGYEPADLDTLNPIHIAGTKGKGSTSSFISSILAKYLSSRESIYAERVNSTVGLYTSPHLRFIRERIKINNEPISEELFARYFWEVWDRLEATKADMTDPDPRGINSNPVYFHYLTLMAFHCYLQQNVDTAVIECGIGGEYDTTNLFIKPAVTGITSLGIDHEALLGNTIDQIAWHKAGIFKPNVPAFTVEQPAQALRVLHDRARERRTDLYVVPIHSALDSIELRLQGHFQTLNASLAVAISALHLGRLGFSGIPDPYDPDSALPDEFVQGLQQTRLGGRCDLRCDSISPNLIWYIDGGHTLESIDVAGRWFASKTAARQKPDSIRMLIFNQQKREASTLARHLYDILAAALKDGKPFQHVIFCTNITYKDAGYKADLVSMNTNKDDETSLRVQHELGRSWAGMDYSAAVHVVKTIEEAVEIARQLADGRAAEVLATGSLHLVGGLIEVLESELETARVKV